MADIELVIKIPEEKYYNTLQYVKCKANTDFENLMIDTIQNGTPLPKGHGRLIDADAITKDLNTLQDAFTINTDALGRGVLSISCNAPTIEQRLKDDMADIELVIKISEDNYKSIIEKYDTFPKQMKEWGLSAIKNGIPLSKGHGRLIDADTITKDINTLQDAFTINTDALGRGVISISCNALTIIEADKAESEVSDEDSN